MRGRNVAGWLGAVVVLLLGAYQAIRSDAPHARGTSDARPKLERREVPQAPVEAGAVATRDDFEPARAENRKTAERGQYELGSIRNEDERARVREMLAVIDRGGPFRYRQDGVVFQNREARLPRHPRGYYREYTVTTPGAKTRGARRIVRGERGETYYTNDHYRSFVRIDH